MALNKVGGFTLSELTTKHKGGLDSLSLRALIEEHGVEMAMSGQGNSRTGHVKVYGFADGEARINLDTNHIQMVDK